MKKTVMFTLAIAAAMTAYAQPKPAEGQVYYTPAGALARGVHYLDPATNQPIEAGNEVSVATQLSADVVSLYSGGKIKSLTLVGGAGPSNSAIKDFDPLTSRTYTFFLSNSLTEEPFYTQSITVGEKCYTSYDFDLTVPQTIDGSKPLYVGVTYPILTTSDYYMAMDAGKGAPVYIAVSKPGDAKNYVAAPSTYGYPLFGLLLEGDALPQHGVRIVSTTPPRYVNTEGTFDIPVRVRSTGAAKIEKVTYDYTVNGIAGSKEVRILDPETLQPTALLNGEEGLADLSGIKCSQAGQSSSALLRITKVEGDANVTASQAASYCTFVSFPYSTDYKRIPVLEEATSVGCQYCPAGAALTEYLSDNYPGEFISLAYHVDYGSTRDMMKNEWSKAFADRYAQGYPYGIYNRIDTSRLGYESKLTNLAKIADGIYEDCRENQSYADIDFEGVLDDVEDPTSVSLKAGVKFAIDVPKQNDDAFQLSFVLVEDHVGPYKQSNAYSSIKMENGYATFNPESGYDDMGGWEKLGSRVDTKFDHVVRRVEGFPGISGSVPTGLSAGEESVYTATMPLEDMKNKHFNVVALLINVATGEIVNARQITYNLQPCAETPVIFTRAGKYKDPVEIVIKSDPGTHVYYTIDGSDPTVESDEYLKPFVLTNSTTVKAMAVEEGKDPSDIAEAVFEIKDTVGIDEVEMSDVSDLPAIWYNLQGFHIDNPSVPGIYVKVQGSNVRKVLVR